MVRKRNTRQLTVKSTEQLSTHMRRVTLAGDDLNGFPPDAAGGYIKLLFPGETPDKPVLRTYTVSRQRYDPNELDIDFMLHVNPDGDVGGVAAAWAACEFKSMQKIRQFVRDEKAVPKSHRYISSYWKKGLKEEAHRIAKKEDAAN